MRLSILIILVLSGLSSSAQEYIFIEPGLYLCHKIEHDFTIDGNINKQVWGKADWTDLFVDIEGRDNKKPDYNTKAKMLWSNLYLYFAFQLDDPHIWATITQKDAVIFHDNDIELFIDPNGDTHQYYEIEINALNTIWDLFIAKPYREGGVVLNGFDFAGLQTAVRINGTINNPKDKDESWYVEVAIPWSDLKAHFKHRRLPNHGEQMRINFSRVQWETEIVDGVYSKRTDPETGKIMPENNWVWSPIGAIDMHRPELWGIVTFIDTPDESLNPASYYRPDIEQLRQLLAFIYKQQKRYKRTYGQFADSLSGISVPQNLIADYQIQMNVMSYTFEITGSTPDKSVSYLCNTEGRLIQIK